MNKFIRILFFIFFVGINTINAYYENSNYNENIFNTNSYNFKINGNGGVYKNSTLELKNNKLILPKPTNDGYNLLGYSTNESGSATIINSISIDEVNNKEIYAIWDIINYKIDYNLNGGTLDNLKTSYNVLETFTLSSPIKSGYKFIGWTGSNGSIPSNEVTIKKGTTGNLYYIANWSANSYLVDVNSIIDGITYNAGLSGYTFDVWINGTLVADDVIDWCQNVIYGSTIRVRSNLHDGMSVDYDKTITVTNDTILNPSWSKNYYKISYYVNNNLYKEENVGYNDKINIPTYAYNPWEVWDGWSNNITTMPNYDIRIDGYYHEANCYAWAGHPKAENGSAIMKQVINAAKKDFKNVVGPYEETSLDGRLLLSMRTESYSYSILLSKLRTSMNRYTWWSYAEARCDNGYGGAIYK